MLQTRAIEAFDLALRHAGGDPQLEPLRAVLANARAHLDEAMRVAVVGHIKAGKSTLVNALVGELVSPTGKEELTYNVNWLRYGEREGVRVHFKDDRPPQRFEPGALAALLTRTEVPGELLRAIRYVEVQRPAPMLKNFELVDTPGLRSFFEQDSENTMRALGISGEEVEGDTKRESGLADALVCLFNRSLASAEQSVVAEFQGPLLGDATPINAIGVLTKCDAYWSAADPDADPLEVGAEVARAIAREPGADRVFYVVLPVAGLVGFGARTLTAAELDGLAALAAVPRDALLRRLGFAERFARREYDDLPLPAAARAELLARLGQWGVWLATRLLAEGMSGDELRDELWRRSGVARLRDLTIDHFGRRALLIKTQRGVQLGRNEARRARRLGSAAAAAAGGALEALEHAEPAFEEFALLRRYYREPETLALHNGESEELLRVTGERGTALGPRLGLARLSEPAVMVDAAEARLAHWRRRGGAFGADTRAVDTARTMAGAYERLLYHAREAQRHLELDG